MASDAPYLSFIDNPEDFPLSGGVPATNLPPEIPVSAENQPPLEHPSPTVVPLPSVAEPVLKFRLSLRLPSESPRHFHIWEIFVYSEPSAVQHYTYLLERQPYLAHLVERCVVETYHVACLTRTPTRVHVRAATPEYTPLTPVPSPVPAPVPETPPEPYPEDSDGWGDHSLEAASDWADLAPLEIDIEDEDKDPEEVEDEDVLTGWALPASPRFDL